jgi:prophage antirepressor-like protein
MRSKLPAAERFERWIVEEILPKFRSSGVVCNGETLEA